MKHTCTSTDAPLFLKWLAERGGLAIWQNIDLSTCRDTVSWTTPRLQADGTPTPKPSWRAANDPVIITDAAEVEVSTDREVKRFHVALRQRGHKIEATDAASRRIRAAVARAGAGAFHTFDYGTQEAVILAPAEVVPLLEWAARQEGGAQ